MDLITEFHDALQYAAALIILAKIAEISYSGRPIRYGDSESVPTLDDLVRAHLTLKFGLAGGHPSAACGIG